MESVRRTMATLKYTLVGETLRFLIPAHMLCSIGCGGRTCKYEDPSRWSEDQQATRGLYSSCLLLGEQTQKKRSFLKALVWRNSQEWNERNAKGGDDEKEEEDEVQVSEVPFLTIQSELNLEARRLLVAQSLAFDLKRHEKEEHVHGKVTRWQTDLNSQGGFVGVCSERDPFVLAGILWSWLEQLQEPVFSVTDVQTLKLQNPEHRSLNSLQTASRETLRCVLDCFARLLVMPEEVEEAFVERVIKAFTWMENVGDGQDVYETMMCVLKRVLRELRRNAMEQQDAVQ